MVHNYTSASSSTTLANAVFNVGTTTVIWTATDASGNVTTCTQTIQVVDNQAPVFANCPANMTIGTYTGCTGGTTWTAPTATDNCSSATVTQTSGPTSGTTLTAGVYTIVYTASDAAGNTATCSFTITVNATSAPVIQCPTSATYNTTIPSGCSWISPSGSLAPTLAAANCPNTVTWTISNPNGTTSTGITNASGYVFNSGVSTLTYTITDPQSATAQCSTTITVIETVLPTIIAPANVSVNTNTGCTATGISIGTPVTSDNCTVASVTNNAPSIFTVGNTTVTWTVLDAAGNTATATQVITVTDNVVPTITAPAAMTVSTNTACTATGVSLGTPVTADNCSVASVVNNAPTAFPLGNTTVTWTVTDASGLTATATQVITVVDNTNPSISAPANISVNANSACAAFNVNLGTPIATDNCSVASVVNNAPSVFSLGSTNVTWTVTDASGNTATATQVVTVVDNTNPTIVAPAAMTVQTNTACTATGVVLGTPVTTDNCTVASVTNNAPVAFPLGNTTVTWTVTDAVGNLATATQVITVIDNVNPTITAPANITANATASCAVTGLALGTPVTVDNCSVASVTNNAPSTFPLGTTTITWTVIDGSGRTATATQTVTVIDNTNPTITAPANVTVNANNACAAFNVALGTPVTSDNCSVASVVKNAPTVFPLGITIVTWTVTDGSGLTATATQVVTVVDNTNPTIVAPAAMTVQTNTACTATGVVLGNPLTNDNCSIASVSNNAPVAFPLGNTTVTWTVTDGSGNTSTATQVITVIDNVNPTITAPANITINATASCAVTGLALGTPVTADNCSVASVTNNAPSTFSLGTTTITWTVIDGSGRTATATQTVTVVDNTNPTITAPANVTVNANNACAAFNVALGTPVTADNCTVASVANNAPSVFPLGNTTVTWTVTDGAGLTATATQVVTVVDIANPSIIAPTAISVSANNACTATGVVLGTPITFDNCSISSVSNNAPLAFPLGSTTVTWTATDGSGNIATATQLVTVMDNVNPTITAPLNLTINANAACTATGVALGTPVTADNCSVASVTNNAPSTFQIGTTNVTWIVTDGSGNIASATQTVTVVDNTNPTITAPANVSVNANSSCAAFNVALGTPVTADNCSVASVANNAPTVFPLGNTTVTWTVTDGAGLTATATQVVTVVDNTNPTIVAPIALTVSTNTACTATGVVLGNPVTNDNCTVASVTNNAPVAFPLGNTTVTWTVTDGSGNTSTATQVVTVVDNVNPIISAPANITTNASASCAVTGLALGTPVTSDNCSVISVTNNAPATFVIGTTTVTWTVTDASGNTATAIQTVTIVDNTNPTITAPANVTLNANSACSAFNVALGTPVTVDNCSVASVTNNAPTVFPIGTTTVTWTVTDAAGLTATTTQTVTIVDQIVPVIYAPVEVITYANSNCEATNVNLGIPVTSDNCTVASVVNNGLASFPIGTTTVTWTVTDGYGNTATAQQLVTVLDTISPTAVITNISVNLLTTGPVEITAQDVAGASFDNCGVSSIELSKYAFNCSDLGINTVLVTITDNYGNKTQVNAEVTVLLSGYDLDFDGIDDGCDPSINVSTIEVPNGFTPDGDNYNDQFVIPGLTSYTSIELHIYDRYGNMVYESANYANDWNGTSMKGNELPDDTYFYVLTLDGTENRQGYVYINRVK
jgi:gliding motility-associated-like protein